MAEYIDRERLKEVFDRNVVSAGVFNDIIDAQPTADVVEREKIDKAIEEIDDLDRYFDNDYFSGNSDAMFKCSDVLAILDKLIESEGK